MIEPCCAIQNPNGAPPTAGRRLSNRSRNRIPQPSEIKAQSDSMNPTTRRLWVQYLSPLEDEAVTSGDWEGGGSFSELAFILYLGKWMKDVGIGCTIVMPLTNATHHVATVRETKGKRMTTCAGRRCRARDACRGVFGGCEEVGHSLWQALKEAKIHSDGRDTVYHLEMRDTRFPPSQPEKSTTKRLNIKNRTRH